jgi:hypothetical protein
MTGQSGAYVRGVLDHKTKVIVTRREMLPEAPVPAEAQRRGGGRGPLSRTPNAMSACTTAGRSCGMPVHWSSRSTSHRLLCCCSPDRGVRGSASPRGATAISSDRFQKRSGGEGFERRRNSDLGFGIG